MTRTVKVQFPDGEREIEPESWSIEPGRPPKPQFHPSPFNIVETVDGRFIAVRSRPSDA